MVLSAPAWSFFTLLSADRPGWADIRFQGPPYLGGLSRPFRVNLGI